LLLELWCVIFIRTTLGLYPRKSTRNEYDLTVLTLSKIERVEKIYAIYSLRSKNRLLLHNSSNTGIEECSEDFLNFCANIEFDSEGFHSIETGLGMSTLCFTAFGWDHIAITPNKDEIRNFEKWIALREHKDVLRKKVKLYSRSSKDCLPKIARKRKDFNFAFIDGNHSYPHVFIDYTYMSNLVGENGLLAIGSTNLEGPNLLVKYMEKKTYWDVVKRGRNWIIFRKNSKFEIDQEEWQDSVLGLANNNSRTAS
jgi:hypothetical protein